MKCNPTNKKKLWLKAHLTSNLSSIHSTKASQASSMTNVPVSDSIKQLSILTVDRTRNIQFDCSVNLSSGLDEKDLRFMDVIYWVSGTNVVI